MTDLSTTVDHPMPNAPRTPNDETPPAPAPLAEPVVDFSPATVPYNEAFQNELMDLILGTSTTTYPPRTPSVDVPLIPASALPIPLSSPLRSHSTSIPNLYTTHPGGYHTGGPAPPPSTIASFAASFIAEHGIEDAGQLERVVEAAVQNLVKEVKARMRARKEAVEKNREVDRALEDLRLQRSAEIRVLERLKEKR